MATADISWTLKSGGDGAGGGEGVRKQNWRSHTFWFQKILLQNHSN